MHLYVLLMCGILALFPGSSNRLQKEVPVGYVRISGKHHPEKFVLSKESKFELRNGEMNIVAMSTSKELFEVNGIPEWLLKDTLVKKASVKVVWIREKETLMNDGSMSPIRLLVKTKGNKTGNPLSIRISSTWNGFSVDAMFVGKIPKRQFERMDHKN